MERYKEKKKDLHMVFIDLEKAYNKTGADAVYKLWGAAAPTQFSFCL
jgi:hypothetical protein